MKKKKLLCLAVLCVAALAGSADAVVITFDDLEVAGTDSTQFPSYSSSGFDFTTGAANFASWHQGHPFYLDSAALFANSPGDTVTLAATGGGLFTLNAIDLDLVYAFGTANVHFYAYDAGANLVGDLSVDLTVDGWQTVNFGSDFDGVAYVQWAQTSDYHHFDNVTLNATAPVPEPATLSLLGLGLAGLAMRQRRKNG